MWGKIITIIFSIIFFGVVLMVLKTAGGLDTISNQTDKISDVFTMITGNLGKIYSVLPWVQDLVYMFSAILVIETILFIIRIINFFYRNTKN